MLEEKEFFHFILQQHLEKLGFLPLLYKSGSEPKQAKQFAKAMLLERESWFTPRSALKA